MKLITLQIVPDKDQCTVIVSIDYAPSEFKSCYVTLTYGRDGNYHLTSIPPHIDKEVLNKAIAYGQSIIDTALTSLKPLFDITSEPKPHSNS